jgi:hypothetical protein
VRGGGALASTGPQRPRAGEGRGWMGDAMPNHNATLPTHTTPERACPARLRPPPTATVAPAAKERSGFVALDAHPLACCLILRTNEDCFGKAEPTLKHTRRASSSQGGAPVKSLGGGSYWGPNFLRGGCLDGSAATATATKERLASGGRRHDATGLGGRRRLA